MTMWEILRDQSWGAAGAVAGIAALILALVDRSKKKKAKNYVVHGFLGMFGFGLIGASYGLFAMFAGGRLGDILAYFGIARMSGNLGDLLSRLSRVQFGYWGF